MAKSKKSSAPSFSSEHRKNIARCIDIIGRVHNPWKVFDDFLTVCAIAISNNSDPYNVFTRQELKDEREKRYRDIIGAYSKGEGRLFISMFAELVNELESYFGKDSIRLVDVLGELFSELGFNNHWKGQFFTPSQVCDFMGESTLGDGEDCKKFIKKRGYFTVLEPCCGGGAIIYGVANAMHKIGFNHNKDALFFATDIDERCIFMTYIQCSLYGIPAIILQKNFLTGEVLSEPWFTPMFVFYGWRWGDAWKEWLV